MKIISVFGANDPAPDSDEYELAYQAGKTLASLGYGVANGGYAGTMQASAKGAKSKYGTTYGVTCDIWSSQANEYIDHVVRTSRYIERLETLIDLGSGGYVILPGATGTLVEAAMVWEHACKRFWGKQGKSTRPIAFMGEFWQPLREMMIKARPASDEFVHWLTDPEQLSDVFQQTV